MTHWRHRWWFAGMLLAALPCPGQARVYQTSAVVFVGDPLPFAGGPAAAGTILPWFHVSGAGQIAFTAAPEGAPLEQGVFRATGGNIEAIALLGDPAPPGTGGAVFGYLVALGVDADGDVLFYANDCAGPCYEGLFLSTPAGVVPVVITGQPAPGTGGGSFSGLDFGSVAFDGAGGVAFEASLSGGSTGSGVFLAGGGQVGSSSRRFSMA